MAIESVSEGAMLPPEKQSFMKGKALASAMVLETKGEGGGGSRDIVTDFRPDGESIPQDNFTRKYLQVLLASPELLGVFSAALTHMLEEGFDQASGIAECVAETSYEACHSHIGDDYNRFTAPPLQAQLRAFDLHNLAPARGEVVHG